jgi:O-antigen/teichoic acid export membrane protein
VTELPNGTSPPSLASRAAATFATNVGAAALGLANVLVVARALGPEGRGEVAFLTTVGVLSAGVATLGIEQATANLGVRRELRPTLAGNAAAFATVLGLGAAGVLAGIALLLPATFTDADPEVLALVLLSIPAVVLGTYLAFLVQADYRFGVFNAAWLVAPVTQVSVNGVLAAGGWLTSARAVAAWVLGQLLATALLAAYVLFRLDGYARPKGDLAREQLGFGLRSHAGRVLTLGNYRFDQWLLGAIAGTRELGLYSVAVAWAEVLFFLPTVVAYVQRPDLVRASDEGSAARAAAAALRLALVLTAAAAVVLALAAPLLCTGVFGSAFAGSVDDLRVLAFGAFGMVALKLLGNALTARGLPLVAAAAVAVAFVVTVVLDLVLIPPFGGLGAAIASTTAYTAGGIAVAVLFVRRLGAQPRELVPRLVRS